MAIKSRNKVSVAFSMSSMTDIVFLLLIFFMITSTLIHPTALKLLLPKSDNQTSAKPLTTLSITKDIKYFIEDVQVAFDQIEPKLQSILGNNPDIYVSLHVDQSVPMGEVVKIMNIAKKHQYKIILATSPK